METQQLGAYLQCYKNPFATYNTLFSFRKHYPQGTIVLLSDNGYNYTEMAKYFNCIYINENENLPLVLYQLKDTYNYNKISKLMNRICNAFKLCKEKYIMWLEDDVSVNNIVNEDNLIYDLNGYCPNNICKIHLIELQKNYNFLDINKKYVCSGHGGSIFLKDKILNYLQNTVIINDLVNIWKINKFNDLSFNDFAQDYFISLLIILQNGTIGSYNGHLDDSSNLINPNIIIQHQYKRWYDVSMPDNLKNLVNYS